MKICRKCGETKEDVEFDTGRRECVQCRKKYFAEKYAKEKDKGAEYRAAYRAARRRELADKQKAYVERNKEKVKAARAAYYQKNKERLDARQKRYEEANKDSIAARRLVAEKRAGMLIWAATARAKKFGREINLSKEAVVAGIAAGVCPKTGRPFDLTPSTRGSMNIWSPSIDRIRSEKGYTDDNVRIVSTAYNTSKSNMTEAEHLEFCLAVVRTAGYECQLTTASI
jgi:hypothetical protein